MAEGKHSEIGVIEAEVHKQLYAFLKHEGEAQWPHHLTIARLVARALRVDRSALIQISPMAEYRGRYRLSYLVPLFLWTQSAIIVASHSTQSQLLNVDIPRFRHWSPTPKPVYTAQDWPGSTTTGLLLLSPQDWLTDFGKTIPIFPETWPIIVDGADQLEQWVTDKLTLSIQSQDWEKLMLVFPAQADSIRDIRAQLTQKIFQHPRNPYGAILMNETKRNLFLYLFKQLSTSPHSLPVQWQQFHSQLTGQSYSSWIEIHREIGNFTTHIMPGLIDDYLPKLFTTRTAVLLGSTFGDELGALRYRKVIGLEDSTYIHFAAERPVEEIQLYLPDKIPMPNTPAFQSALFQSVQQLIVQGSCQKRPIIVIVDDVPLKSQLTAHLASIFGTRVSFESKILKASSIVVMGWQFWLERHSEMVMPSLLIMATLPIPSPEDPKVAGRINHYKKCRQDWFRLYLLPRAIQTLQKAIAPIRNQRTVVAIFDNRLLHRTYGEKILAALSPYVRINSVDFEPDWSIPAKLPDVSDV